MDPLDRATCLVRERDEQRVARPPARSGTVDTANVPGPLSVWCETTVASGALAKLALQGKAVTTTSRSSATEARAKLTDVRAPSDLALMAEEGLSTSTAQPTSKRISTSNP